MRSTERTSKAPSLPRIGQETSARMPIRTTVERGLPHMDFKRSVLWVSRDGLSQKLPERTPVEARSGRGEAVAGAAHGLHQAVELRGFERLAQSPDMHVHGALFHEDVVAPYLVQQLGARMHSLRVRHQKMQQAEFSGAQYHRFAVARDAVAGRIEFQPPELHHVIGHLRRA